MKNEIIRKVEQILTKYDYTIDELYVHKPSPNRDVHLEEEEDFTNINNHELHLDIMPYVDVSNESSSTKHELINVLTDEEN